MVRPIEEWPDGEAHRVYFTDDSLMEKMEALQSQVEALKSTLEPAHQGGQMIGASAAFRHAYELMQKVAQTQVAVLLTGETGVGKERFARSLHALSTRAEAPFVAVNCAALPAELIEAELFGVEKGAYTGAHASSVPMAAPCCWMKWAQLAYRQKRRNTRTADAPLTETTRPPGVL